MGYNGAFGFHNNNATSSGGLTYSGTWNALTNVPLLASGVGTSGEYYIVSVAGTTNLDGITDWLIGDWAIFNGTAWQKIDNSGISYQGNWDALTNTPTLTSSVGFDGHFYIVNVAGSTNLNGITSWLVGDWAIFTGGVWLKLDNTSGIGGSGTTNFVSKFTGASSIGDSQIFDNGTDVGIGTILPTAKLTTKGIDATSANYAFKVENTTPSNLFSVRNDGVIDAYGTITPRIQSVVSSAIVTPTNLNDEVVITAQAVGLTLANPTGTPVQGQSMIIRITDNGTARTIAYDTQYRAIGVTLPTTTVINKILYLSLIYNSTDTKWDVINVSLEGTSSGANSSPSINLFNYYNFI